MRMKLRGIFIVFFLLFALSSVKVSAAPPSGFQVSQVIATGLEGPTGFAIAPDGRIFILERTGKVLIFKNNQLLATPFANLPSAATGDRGLTGIAFDPDFATNSYVYIYHTGEDLINRLVRFDASGDVGTDMVEIYRTESPSFELHIGGTIAFGPDGKLYISIGDNGVSTNAQNLSNPHGKILRINKDGTIPTDNPFYGQPDVRQEIWAYGFRNPFRFQFDPFTGNLFAGDVGDATWEEVNFIQKGVNYGWPNCEGVCADGVHEDPIYTYNHDGQSSAVVVGPIYRGGMFPPDYQGRVFVGDYARGFIRTLESHDSIYHPHDFDPSAGSVVDMKEAADGSIYYITYIPGRLYRLSYSTDSSVPVAVSSADVTGGTEPLTVNFSSAGSYDPDSDPLQFYWEFGDGTSSTEANPTKVYTEKGAYTVELTVSDGTNSSVANPIIVQVGIPPTIHIGSPGDGSTYKAGDTIFYSASAVDSAGFDLHDSSFTTEIIFHHGDHIHPFIGPLSGNKSGEFTIPRSGEPDVDQWYEIKITATDSKGLSSTETVNIYPEVVNLTLQAFPFAFDVLLNGVRHATPYTFPSIKGYEHVLSVPVIQEVNGEEYQFHHWGHGGRTENTIQTPSVDTAYTAFFEQTIDFQGNYYNNMALSGEPTLIRTDPVIDFNWGFDSPDQVLPVDGFSAKWTKRQYFSEGRYILSTVSDDGARLSVNGNILVDEWHNQSPTRHYKIVYLLAGEYDIVMDYFEDGGGAVAIFDVELALDQSVGEPLTGNEDSLKYWNYTPGTTPGVPSTSADYQVSNPTLYYNWGSGSPDSTITTDYFVARYAGTKVFEDGTYRFKLTADDGVRLFVDGELIIDKWVDQAPTTYSIDRVMTAGSHNIVIEYYEKTGGAVLEFSYDKLTTTEPTPTPTPPPAGQGLLAEYYDTADLTGTSIKRTDPVINFNWGSGSPDSAISPDTFSARWSGEVEVPTSGEYTFYTIADDGVRLWVNGQQLINEWHDSAPNETASLPITLSAGTRYEISMEYYENGGGAMAQLLWSSPTVAKQIVSTDYLFTSTVVEPSTAFTAEYWQFTGEPVFPTESPLLTRQEDAVYYNWGTSSPDPVLAADNFIARWTKQETFEDGTYQLKVTADDGVRVYIDGSLILDQWVDQAPTTFLIDQVMTAGIHEVKIEYYEKGGGAVCEVEYNKI